MRPLIKSVFAILILVALATVVTAIPSIVTAQTENQGTITGTVSNGTTGNIVAGIEVTLSAFNNDGLIGDTTTTADDEGNYVFTELDTSDGIVYATSVSWRGVLYSSGMIQINQTGESDSAVTVFETTTDRTLISVSTRGLVLTGINVTTGNVTFLDITGLESPDDLTFVAGDTGRSLEFAIPRNAGAPQLQPGFDFGNASIENSVISATSPLRPGGATAMITYPVRYTGTSLTIDIQQMYQTEIFRILVPVEINGEELNISIAGMDLIDQGIDFIGEQEYHVWAAADLGPNATIRVAFSDLPESRFRPNELKVLEPTLLAAGALLVASVITVIMIRKKRVVAIEPEIEESVTAGFVESREELVLQLQGLQDQYDSGMLEEQVYLSERRFLLEKLRAVTRYLRDLPEESDPVE